MLQKKGTENVLWEIQAISGDSAPELRCLGNEKLRVFLRILKQAVNRRDTVKVVKK